MAIGWTAILSLSVDITLAVFAAALAFLVLWQDPRRRSNQYFGLSMAVFSLYAMADCPLQVAQVYNLHPENLLKSVTTLYVLAIVLLFSFALRFAGLPSRIRWAERAFSVPLAALFITGLWTGRIFTEFESQGDGGYTYQVTTLTRIGVVAVTLYMISIVALLYRHRSPQAREMTLPMATLAAGLVGTVLIEESRAYAPNIIAVTLAVVILGRLVLKYQFFKPLADLNAELAIKNVQISEATRLKSQFLANMSHELRTPLNSILGYTELVIQEAYGGLTEMQSDRLEKVSRNGHLLLELINDVLDLSKIEAGRLELAQMRVETVELLDQLMEEYTSRAQDKGLSLVRAYGTLPALNVDAPRTRQIFRALLSNAIKFTEQGAIIVRGHYDWTRRQVVLSVSDTGPGIDVEQQERIFSPFQEGERILARYSEGTGLGLAIARRLTELHLGHLWMDSTPGQGSTFHVSLPTADVLPDAAPTVTPGTRAKGPVILAVDDNREAIEVLQGKIEPKGYRVYGACTAADGLKLAHELQPALITLDLRMPDMSGQEVLAILRRDPTTAAIPVIVISATDDRQEAQSAGAELFMTKPVATAELLEHIKRLAPRVPTPTPLPDPEVKS